MGFFLIAKWRAFATKNKNHCFSILDMELIIKIWRFGISPTEIYHKNLIYFGFFFLGNLANLGHLSMKNPFYRPKLHFSGRNLIGFRPIFLKKLAKKTGGDLFAAAPPPRGKLCLHSEREKQTNPRAHSQLRLRACVRAGGRRSCDATRPEHKWPKNCRSFASSLLA